MSVRLHNNIPTIQNQLKLTVPHALQAGAEMMAEAARERVPVRTGKLRDAIHVEKRAAGIRIAGRSVGADYSDWAVVAGNKDAFYAHLVEFGTEHSPAQPFLVPAFEHRKTAVEALVSQALQHRFKGASVRSRVLR